MKEAGKLLKWALMQQKNAESKYATEGRVHEAKCKLLEAKISPVVQQSAWRARMIC